MCEDEEPWPTSNRDDDDRRLVRMKGASDRCQVHLPLNSVIVDLVCLPRTSPQTRKKRTEGDMKMLVYAVWEGV